MEGVYTRGLRVRRGTVGARVRLVEGWSVEYEGFCAGFGVTTVFVRGYSV